MRLATLALLLFLIILPSLSLFAQRDTVRPAPGQVELRRIWMIKGAPGSRTGVGAGPVGDINHDGIGDFAVSTYIPWQWSVYLGDTAGPSTTPVWKFDSCAALRRPVVGDFWGTGHKAVGFVREVDYDYSYAFLHLFRTESGWLPDTAALIWESVGPDIPRVIPFGKDYLAADLDGDGDDELIISCSSVRRGEINNNVAEIWIYKGGPDFQIKTPSVIVRGEKAANQQFQLYVANLDGDDYPDLVARSDFSFDSRVEFYYGRPGFFTATQRPDREIVLVRPVVTDIDGDDIGDIITDQFNIYRSGGGKDMRTRSYNADDIDHTIFSGRGDHRRFDMGYIASRKYRMFGVVLVGTLTGFSGSPDGLDGYSEAFTGGGGGLSTSPFGQVLPVGDVNGDGWDDLICSELSYPDQGLDYGIAILFAGGPYIPNDDPVVGVRRLSLEQKSNALSLWPNPVRTELNIAWRGDLARMPRRFEIHDMLGRIVSHGSVPEGDGAAIWRCGDQPSGSFLLSLFDGDHLLLASTRFVKQ